LGGGCIRFGSVDFIAEFGGDNGFVFFVVFVVEEAV